MLLLLRSEIFLYLRFGRHTKLNGVSLELGFGVVVANHFTFVSVKSGLTSLLKRCDKHFGPAWPGVAWPAPCQAGENRQAQFKHAQELRQLEIPTKLIPFQFFLNTQRSEHKGCLFGQASLPAIL